MSIKIPAAVACNCMKLPMYVVHDGLHTVACVQDAFAMSAVVANNADAFSSGKWLVRSGLCGSQVRVEVEEVNRSPGCRTRMMRVLVGLRVSFESVEAEGEEE